jgi:hypothetical protein
MDRPPIYPIPTEPEFSGRIGRRPAPAAGPLVDPLADLERERQRVLDEIEQLLRSKPFTPLA